MQPYRDFTAFIFLNDFLCPILDNNITFKIIIIVTLSFLFISQIYNKGQLVRDSEICKFLDMAYTVQMV